MTAWHRMSSRECVCCLVCGPQDIKEALGGTPSHASQAAAAAAAAGASTHHQAVELELAASAKHDGAAGEPQTV